MAKALRVDEPGTNKFKIVDIELPNITEGQVLIKSKYSSLNYKDALAVTGQGKILRSFPLIPGIDVCGEIIESQSQHFQQGDLVLQTGGNLGETYNGGFSEQVVLGEQNCFCLLYTSDAADE